MRALQFAIATVNLACQNAFLFLATHGPIFILFFNTGEVTHSSCTIHVSWGHRRLSAGAGQQARGWEQDEKARPALHTQAVAHGDSGLHRADDHRDPSGSATTGTGMALRSRVPSPSLRLVAAADAISVAEPDRWRRRMNRWL